MSEYLHVKKPILDHLAGLNWKVKEQSLRFPSFKAIHENAQIINLTPQGKPVPAGRQKQSFLQRKTKARK